MSKLAALALGLLLALTGCGDSGRDRDATTAASRTGTAPDAAALMRTAVEHALADNLALSRRVLWTNRVPASARDSTRGAALIELRRSAAERRREQVRVRVVSRDVRFVTVRIDPSYERATATVVNRDRVRIVRPGSRDRFASADERAHVELRRIDKTADEPRFVVWQVSGAR